jgi:plastocyanin
LRFKRLTISLVALAVLAALTAPLASSTAEPTIEAVNSGYTHYWLPSSVSVGSGGAVTISNPTGVFHGVEWRSGTKPSCSAGVPVGSTPAASGANWTGKCTFSQAGTYTFYCTVHGPEMTGTVTVTNPGAPTVVTGAAGGVGESEATLNGSVDPQGKATTFYFNYGTSTAYGPRTPDEPAGEGAAAAPVSAAVGSLAPGTTYHYQLVATNGSGTTFGADRTFTTALPPGPPLVATGAASAVAESAATMQGTVDPDGRPTHFHFEWGASAAYGQSTAEGFAGEDHAGNIETVTLTGLDPGTTYHFRLVASNALGTVPGGDHTFTTASPPPGGPAPSPQPPTAAPHQPVAPVASLEAAVAPPPIGAPSLRARQHGYLVRGLIDVSADGAGGRLRVDLLAARASLASRPGAPAVLVGRAVRAMLPGGRQPFVVALSSRGRIALRRRHHLRLTVEITLTPLTGRQLVLTRQVTLSA